MTDNQNITISFPKAFAQTDKLEVGVPIPSKGGAGAKTYTSSADNRIYQQYMNDLYSFAINLGTSLATLMIVYAGYKYMTSQGNQTALNDAKEVFAGAMLGMAILLLVRVILRFLNLPDVTTS